MKHLYRLLLLLVLGLVVSPAFSQSITFYIGFDIAEREGKFYIQEVERQSAADLAGLQAGDEVLSINELAIANIADPMLYLAANAQVNLRFQRGDSIYSVELSERRPLFNNRFATEPANMPEWQFPFPYNVAWGFGGTHGTNMSALDFWRVPQRPWGQDTSDEWIVAAADGHATKFSNCRVQINHGDGWMTEYYHLEGIPEFNNTFVSANEFVGITANTLDEAICEGGGAAGPHVHFTLFYNNQPYGMDGVAFSGWTVHSGRFDYDADPNYMWLIRDNFKKYAEDDIVLNDPNPTDTFTIAVGDSVALVNALYISSANAFRDTIYLAPNATYNLDTIYAEASALPLVWDDVPNLDLTIIGNNATITRTGATELRFLQIREGAEVLIQDMTFNNGFLSNDDGGAIENLGNLTLQNVSFTNNRASWGGALHNAWGGFAFINESVFDNNEATNSGGAIRNYQADLTMQFSSISNNQGNWGGAISTAEGRLNLFYNRFTDNSTTSGSGGAVENWGNLFALGNTYFSNDSGGWGGAVHTGSTGVSRLVNETYSANTAQNGAAVSNDAGNVRIDFATAYGNSRTTEWGGIFSNENSGTMSLRGVLISNSTGSNCRTVTSRGYNISSDATCGFAGTGDANSTNPLLNALADNGGSVQTHSLQTSSPAINRVPTSACGYDHDFDSNTADVLLTSDAREYRRPSGANCDSGAFERGASTIVDVNSDGKISPSDAVYIVNRIGTTDLSADTTGDGLVNSADVQRIYDLLGN